MGCRRNSYLLLTTWGDMIETGLGTGPPTDECWVKGMWAIEEQEGAGMTASTFLCHGHFWFPTTLELRAVTLLSISDPSQEAGSWHVVLRVTLMLLKARSPDCKRSPGRQRGPAEVVLGPESCHFEELLFLFKKIQNIGATVACCWKVLHPWIRKESCYLKVVVSFR